MVARHSVRPLRLPRAALLVLPLALAACASSQGRFPLREPLWRDTDLDPVHVACRPDPERPERRLCHPETYVSPIAWDLTDKTLFRPVSRFFAVDPAGEAVNVNSLDEVPDSSWFTNRIGRSPMTPDEVVDGPCGGVELDPDDAAPGSWVIDMGKPDGANPGFRVQVEGVGRFMLKADLPDQPERATAATAIAARLYHAAGWFSPCDSVVYLRPELLRLKDGLTYADNSGVARPFDQAALQAVLAKASRRGARLRMVASRWLPGRTLGPFRYEGTRDDDPHDVIPHEDRRDLRGARLLAAWLNHFDSREQNTMDTWLSADPRAPTSSPGHVRHYYIDLGDCFGSEWEWDEVSRRLGHAYYFDPGYLLEDLVTLGMIERPWDRARRSRGGEIFGYFRAVDFDPEAWRGGYPNPAFERMTERDGAWAARIIARFTPAHLAAAVRVGEFTNPGHARFLLEQLLARQGAIVRRYLGRLSPLADLAVRGGELCALDLARRSGAFDPGGFRYAARAHAGEPPTPLSGVAVRAAPHGEVCVALPRVSGEGGAPDDAASRYLVVDVENGQAAGVLRAHLYDLGPRRGHRLVGLERPAGRKPPG